MRNFKDTEISDYQRVRISNDLLDVLLPICTEIHRAEAKHPVFVRSLADALLVIGEELGEANQAYIDATYAEASIEGVRRELIETATTVLRALLNFDYFADQLRQHGPKVATNTAKRVQRDVEGKPISNDPFGDIGEILNRICNPKFIVTSNQTIDEVREALKSGKPVSVEAVDIKPSFSNTERYNLQAEAYREIMQGYRIERDIMEFLTGGRGWGKTPQPKENVNEVVDHRNTDYFGKRPHNSRYSEFQTMLASGADSFIWHDGTKVKPRNNRISYSRVYDNIKGDAADVNSFEVWAASMCPFGFAYSHSTSVRTPDNKVKRTVVYKRNA